MFENMFGTVYPDRLRFPAVPGDAKMFNGETVPLFDVLRVAWLYDVYAGAQPLSRLQFWVSLLVVFCLIGLPFVGWWSLRSPKWRVIVTLKSGHVVRSAHRDKWAYAEAFAKAARQAASQLAKGRHRSGS